MLMSGKKNYNKYVLNKATPAAKPLAEASGTSSRIPDKNLPNGCCTFYGGRFPAVPNAVCPGGHPAEKSVRAQKSEGIFLVENGRPVRF